MDSSSYSLAWGPPSLASASSPPLLLETTSKTLLQSQESSKPSSTSGAPEPQSSITLTSLLKAEHREAAGFGASFLAPAVSPASKNTPYSKRKRPRETLSPHVTMDPELALVSPRRLSAPNSARRRLSVLEADSDVSVYSLEQSTDDSSLGSVGAVLRNAAGIEEAESSEDLSCQGRALLEEDDYSETAPSFTGVPPIMKREGAIDPFNRSDIVKEMSTGPYRGVVPPISVETLTALSDSLPPQSPRFSMSEYDEEKKTTITNNSDLSHTMSRPTSGLAASMRRYSDAETSEKDFHLDLRKDLPASWEAVKVDVVSSAVQCEESPPISPRFGHVSHGFQVAEKDLIGKTLLTSDQIVATAQKSALEAIEARARIYANEMENLTMVGLEPEESESEEESGLVSPSFVPPIPCLLETFEAPEVVEEAVRSPRAVPLVPTHTERPVEVVSTSPSIQVVRPPSAQGRPLSRQRPASAQRPSTASPRMGRRRSRDLTLSDLSTSRIIRPPPVPVPEPRLQRSGGWEPVDRPIPAYRLAQRPASAPRPASAAPRLTRSQPPAVSHAAKLASDQSRVSASLWRPGSAADVPASQSVFKLVRPTKTSQMGGSGMSAPLERHVPPSPAVGGGAISMPSRVRTEPHHRFWIRSRGERQVREFPSVNLRPASPRR